VWVKGGGLENVLVWTTPHTQGLLKKGIPEEIEKILQQKKGGWYSEEKLQKNEKKKNRVFQVCVTKGGGELA